MQFSLIAWQPPTLSFEGSPEEEEDEEGEEQAEDDEGGTEDEDDGEGYSE